jgi:hypothetical protein
MLLGTVLVVYVSLENAAAPELVPLKAAASEFLGVDSEVRIVGGPELSDQEAIAGAPDADGIVELRFGPDRSTVFLRFYAVSEHAWIDRRIGFSPDDDPVERGRFLGLAVASTLQKTPKPAPAKESRPRARAIEVAARPARDELRLTPPRAPRPPSLRVAATTQQSLDAAFWEVGALVAGRIAIFGDVSGQLGVVGSFGQLRSAGVSSRSLDLGAGIVWDVLPFGSRAGLAARLDCWAGLGDLSRTGQSAVERRFRWRAEGDALGELSYRLGETIGVYGAAGVGLQLGRTVIYARDRELATVPALRLKLELGLSSTF